MKSVLVHADCDDEKPRTTPRTKSRAALHGSNGKFQPGFGKKILNPDSKMAMHVSTSLKVNMLVCLLPRVEESAVKTFGRGSDFPGSNSKNLVLKFVGSPE